MSRTVSIIKRVSAAEFQDSRREIVGILASSLRYVDVDGNGSLEYVCDVRVGLNDAFAIVVDVPVAMGAVGSIADVGLPVLLERSGAGRLTVVGRAMTRLANVTSVAYGLGQLGLEFSAGQLGAPGSWTTPFGFATTAPDSVAAAQTSRVWTPGDNEGGEPGWS